MSTVALNDASRARAQGSTEEIMRSTPELPRIQNSFLTRLLHPRCRQLSSGTRSEIRRAQSLTQVGPDRPVTPCHAPYTMPRQHRYEKKTPSNLPTPGSQGDLAPFEINAFTPAMAEDGLAPLGAETIYEEGQESIHNGSRNHSLVCSRNELGLSRAYIAQSQTILQHHDQSESAFNIGAALESMDSYDFFDGGDLTKNGIDLTGLPTPLFSAPMRSLSPKIQPLSKILALRAVGDYSPKLSRSVQHIETKSNVSLNSSSMSRSGSGALRVTHDRRILQSNTEKRYRQELTHRFRQLHFLVPDESSQYATFIGLDHLESIGMESPVAENPNDSISSMKSAMINLNKNIPNKVIILRKAVQYVKWLLQGNMLQSTLPISSTVTTQMTMTSQVTPMMGSFYPFNSQSSSPVFDRPGIMRSIAMDDELSVATDETPIESQASSLLGSPTVRRKIHLTEQDFQALQHQLVVQQQIIQQQSELIEQLRQQLNQFKSNLTD